MYEPGHIGIAYMDEKHVCAKYLNDTAIIALFLTRYDCVDLADVLSDKLQLIRYYIMAQPIGNVNA